MGIIRVALLQVAACGDDQAANLSRGELCCRQAREMVADIALFPEMWNIGYTRHDPHDLDERRLWQAKATGSNGPFVNQFRELARQLGTAIAITYLEEWPGSPRDSVSLIDRHGETALTYAKVHTCDFDMEASCTPGDDFHVATLDTAKGPVQVGAMICYDREFPESARVLTLKGAELILTPNACTLDQTRIGQFRSRAFENMVGVAMANYPAPQENGHSVAFDAAAYDERGASLDPLIVEAGEEEGIYLAGFDIERIKAYRQRETWGNAFRKPASYGILTSPEVRPPFLRPDARR